MYEHFFIDHALPTFFFFRGFFHPKKLDVLERIRLFSIHSVSFEHLENLEMPFYEAGMYLSA